MTSKTPKQDPVQGEGDYDAGRRYDKAAREFAQSGKVEPAGLVVAFALDLVLLRGLGCHRVSPGVVDVRQRPGLRRPRR